MTSRPFRCFWIGVWVSLFGLASHAGVIRAELVRPGEFRLREANVRETGWKILYNPAQIVGIPEFTGNPRQNETFQGTLTLTKVWDNLNPIEIQFVQEAAAAADNFGLRITLDEAVINRSGVPWGGFKMEVSDTHAFGDLRAGDPDGTIAGVNRFVVPVHPGFSHFHGDFVERQSGDVRTPPFSDLNPPLNGQKILELGNGIFPEGGRQWFGIGIHQIEEKDQRRNFTLRETPIAAVPEPSTWSLLITGAFSVALCWRRSRKRVV